MYEFKCPGSVGKTLFERSCEHGIKDKNSVVLNHIVNCEEVNFIKNIFSIHTKIDTKKFNIKLVHENLRVLDKSRFWNELLIKEALKIKEMKSDLNSGLIAYKELKLF